MGVRARRRAGGSLPEGVRLGWRGEVPPDDAPDDVKWDALAALRSLVPRYAELWREHGEAFEAEWTAEHPGTHSPAWHRFNRGC